MRSITKVATVATATLIAIGVASAAQASVTIDATGHGFVGKGDVQTALGYNNSLMQANAGSLRFTTSQDATQTVTHALSQSATQDGTQSAMQAGAQIGTQSAEQVMIETLSCTKDNGNVDQRIRTGYRSGERTAERQGTRTGIRFATREGSRTGTREGVRSGDLVGKIAASVAYTSRTQNQVNGFNLGGFKSDPSFVADGPAVNSDSFTGGFNFGAWDFPTAYAFGDYAFGDYAFTSDFAFGDTTYTTTNYIAEPNANPDGVCKEGANNVVPGSISLVVTAGDITIGGDIAPGAIYDGGIVPLGGVTPGEISEGDVIPGAVISTVTTPTGAFQLFVNDKAL